MKTKKLFRTILHEILFSERSLPLTYTSLDCAVMNLNVLLVTSPQGTMISFRTASLREAITFAQYPIRESDARRQGQTWATAFLENSDDHTGTEKGRGEY